MLKTKAFLFIFVTFIAIACKSNKGSKTETSQPNFIVLVSDDLRWDALSFNGNKVVQTPNIDSLASQGVYFNNAFVTTPICAVSRASILSGQYAKNHGVKDFSTALDLNIMYPTILSKANYYNGFIGKWGVNAGDLDYLKEVVSIFDYWAGSMHQANYWHEVTCNYANNNGTTNKQNFFCDCPADSRGKEGEDVRIGMQNMQDPKHLTIEIIPKKVNSFFKQRDKSKPFCLSISFKTPHGPWTDYTLRYKNSFNDDNMPILKSADLDHAIARPEFLKNSLNGDLEILKDKSKKGRLQESIRKYYRMIEGMDLAIGKIRETLVTEGLSESTIIIFLSDNGMFLGEHGFRGKWLMYEESVKSPMLIYNPMQDKKTRGKIVEELAANLDVAPTILQYADITPPPKMDGKSLLPLIKNNEQNFRSELYLEHFFTNGTGKTHIEPSIAIRTKNWKYIKYVDQKGTISEELYNVENDSFEMNNKAQKESEKLQELKILINK
jgi:arylsulfatase A-like enzyme